VLRLVCAGVLMKRSKPEKFMKGVYFVATAYPPGFTAFCKRFMKRSKPEKFMKGVY
jgi:hypothetical protein